MTGTANQLDVLQRIATFSAQAHGHQLGAWRVQQFSATAVCTNCGRHVDVYISVIQPDITGPALQAQCDTAEAARPCGQEAA